MKIASSQKSPEICEVSLSLSLVTKSCPSFAIPWTVACQAPLSMGSSRQEYKSGLPFPSPLQSLSSAKITFITGGFSLPCSHWEGEWYSAGVCPVQASPARIAFPRYFGGMLYSVL